MRFSILLILISILVGCSTLNERTPASVEIIDCSKPKTKNEKLECQRMSTQFKKLKGKIIIIKAN